MADAFRGLTIRLGADARPLNSAISSIKHSAQQAQTQLSAMNKALKFDPHNTAAMSKRIDLMGDKAQLAARAVIRIGTAMDQVDGKTKDLAASTTRIYSATEKVRSEYNHTNASLQRIYDSVRRVAAETFGVKSDSKELDEYIKSIQLNYGGATKKAKELTKEMDEFLAKAASTKTMRDRFGLDSAEDAAKQLTGTYRKLRAEHRKYIEESNGLKAAEGFRAMQTQMVAWNAELKKSMMELARFKSELYSLNAGSGIDKMLARIERIDGEIDKATASARKMSAAFEKMPKDTEAARMKIIAEANAVESLKDKAAALEDIIDSIEKTKGFNQLEAQTRNVHKWVSEAEHDFAEFSAKAEVAREKMSRLNAEMHEAEFIGPRRPLGNLEEELNKVEAEFTEASAKAAHFEDELEKANRARRYRQTAEDLNVVQAELEQTKTKAKALRRVLDMASTFRTMGYGLYSTITPAIMIAGRYAIEAAKDIDSAYRDMRKTVNGTEEEFEHLHDAALEFSMTHFTSADTILEIEAMGGQLGIAASSLEAFSETVANLDIATNMDADNIAEQLGKMASVIGISTEEYDNFGDALVRLGNNMPVMEGDIMTLMTRFMGMGKVVGMSADEMLAWSASASATGQKAEAAGSSMQRFISKVETASVNGGEQLEKFAAIAGMSAQEFAEAFSTNASDAMYQFIEGLGEMQKNGDSVNQALTDLGINNVRDKQLLEGLANQMANGSKEANVLYNALKMSSDAYNGLATRMADGSIEEAGDAAREAGRKSEGFSGELQMMANNAQVLASELAQGAIPIIKGLGDMFEGMTSAIRAMPDEMKTFVVGTLGAVAALGPLAVGFGAVGAAINTFLDIAEKAAGARTLSKVASSMSGVKWSIDGLAEIAPRAAIALEALPAKFADIGAGIAKFSPMLALPAAAIAYLGVSISDAAKKADNFNKSVDGMSSAIKDSLPSVNETSGGFDALAKSAQRAVKDLDELTEAQVNVKNAIVERNVAAQSEISSLAAAQSVLHKYLGKTIDSAEAQYQFIAAVDLVNEKCNTQYEVVDAANGKIRDEKGALLETCDAIDVYIDKKKQEIQQQALAADYADAHEQERETYKAMTAQLMTYYDMLDKANKARAEGDYESAAEYEGYAEDAWALYEATHMVHSEAKESADAIEQMMTATALGSDKANKSMIDLVYSSESWVDTFKAAYGEEGWASPLKAFAGALEQAGISQEEFASIAEEDMARVVGAYSRTGDIEAALAEVGLQCHTLAERFSTDFEAIGIDFDALASKLNTNTSDLAQALLDAGYSTQYFSEMGAENFNALAEEAGGDVNALIALLQEYDGQEANAEINVDVDASGAEDGFDEAEAAGEAYSNETYENEAEADPEDAIEGFEDAEDAGEDYADGNYQATADLDTSPAYSALNSLKNSLESFANTTYTAGVSSEERAAGGIALRSIRSIRAIPRNASGGINGIVTRATMTNVGWVGEAGDEALLHMRHAGGAIIPLSNRQHVRPFARAVAAEMGGTGSVVYNYNITLDWEAGEDANQVVTKLANALRTTSLMEG